MAIRRELLGTVCVLALLLLPLSCGGGGGGGGGSGDDPDGSLPGTGGGGATSLISGTGIGTITGFGSIFLNDDRHFEFDDDSRFEIDGDEVTESELRRRGRGMRVRVLVKDDVSDDFSSGTAASVEAENELKGPVTSIDPLRVLGQTVIVTGDTILANLSSPSLLVVGDHVEVSGFRSGENAVQATRLEYVSAGLTEWKLTGIVTGLAGNDLAIGPQVADITGVTPRDCPVGDLTGRLVEVKAGASPQIDGGGRLRGVTDIECKRRGLTIPDGAPGQMKAEVEGLVTSIDTLADPIARFDVNGQTVVTTTTTVYRGGAFEDIAVGARLEAEGPLDTTTGVLAARKISFRGNRVRIRAPATAVDATTGTLTFFNRITVKVTDLTRFESDGVRSIDDVTANTMQLEVEGFVDGSGMVFANEIEDDGEADGRVRLRGPVGPNPQDPVFTILGVTVNTAITSSDDFRIDDAQASRAQFFARIGQPGASAQADGEFDGTVIVAKEVEAED